MKKLLLSVAIAGITLLVSCDKEPKEEPKPFPIGAWQTNHEYFNLTVTDAYPTSDLETIKEEREQEISGAVSESDAYRLTFDENGTGTGSGIRPDNNERYNFEFTWELSDDDLTIEAKSGSEGVLISLVWNVINDSYEWGITEKVLREVKESSADKIVLTTFWTHQHRITDGGGSGWDATETYRYTFERVE